MMMPWIGESSDRNFYFQTVVLGLIRTFILQFSFVLLASWRAWNRCGLKRANGFYLSKRRAVRYNVHVGVQG